MNNRYNEIIEKQSELIQLLEDQIQDLTVMSKIELGDDVIAEIWRLTKEVNTLKEGINE